MPIRIGKHNGIEKEGEREREGKGEIGGGEEKHLQAGTESCIYICFSGS
jgi:hypothetical protein